MVMRGGTSKGAYFLRDDLPTDDARRADLLRRVMGSPDARQIDGIGGAHPLTSKVAIVGPSDDDRADVEYLFLQLGVDTDLVTDRQNCGNILAGVGPFAIERGLFAAEGDDVAVRILMLNSDSIATARFGTHDGSPVYDGVTAIAGVPGTAAAVHLDFEHIAGSSCGTLLPTGNTVDMIDGIAVTLIDNGMPVVVLLAVDLGVTGYEDPADLEANTELRSRLESIRLRAGTLMHLGDVATATVPKLTMVAPPHGGGDICTRTFIPQRCHDAIGVLGAVSGRDRSTAAERPSGERVAQWPVPRQCRRRAPDGHLRCERRPDDRRRWRPHRASGRHRAHRPQAHGRRRVPPPPLTRSQRGAARPWNERSRRRTAIRTHPIAFTPPVDACDAHCHVFGPAVRFPFAADRAYTPPDAGLDDFESLQRRLGLRRAVFVQASCHGTDNAAMVDALHRGRGRYAGVAMIDDTFTDADIGALHDAGVRGARFNFVAHLGGAPEPEVFWRLVGRVVPFGWHIVLHFDASDLPSMPTSSIACPAPT